MNTHEQLLDILKRLLQAKQRKPGTFVRITQQMLVMICQHAKDAISNEPVIVRIAPPLNVVGDIHGQFYDLLRIFEANGHPPDQQYLFLGDYVDRGTQSIETITLLLVYKILFPNHIFLLRGNHECADVNEFHGFKTECVSRYSPRLWNVFNDVFSVFPIAAIVGEKIFAAHAGISPDIMNIKYFDSIERPIPIVEKPLEDLMWSDPDSLAEDWGPNPRGHSYVYGPTQAHKFLDENDLDIILRSHQNVDGGLEFPFEPDRCVVTIFSAPIYGDPVGNDGTVMKIDQNLVCTFNQIKPLERRIVHPIGKGNEIDNILEKSGPPANMLNRSKKL
ncbi:Ser/Thr protein phosphatase [Tritrichomonas foetus]|uniref:Serine/threonine-protein phosphatase n=1 Tax=Tritrichomonas foetus TaxID=1144522 RepID=A0A1J4KNJ4_9EUKA|nr:Ser/Thr protein phosphatase [Tritrichomonas foetus]|eukprot:OHT12480.1 Ser/Thr protein phosphatase [Tritrichomonas foetus]